MRILAIDPGTTETAFVEYDPQTKTVISFGKRDNGELLAELRLRCSLTSGKQQMHVAIEKIVSYGKPVGQEIFDTCVYIGRLLEVLRRHNPVLISRKDVKMHLCDTSHKVTDAVIRQRIIDIFGPGKEKAIGLKKSPGPLYGIKADCWAALAVAITYAETTFSKGDTSCDSTS